MRFLRHLGRLLRELFGFAMHYKVWWIIPLVVLLLGLNTDDLKLLTALVVAVFLAMPYWKNAIVSRKLKGGKHHA